MRSMRVTYSTGAQWRESQDLARDAAMFWGVGVLFHELTKLRLQGLEYECPREIVGEREDLFCPSADKRNILLDGLIWAQRVEVVVRWHKKTPEFLVAAVKLCNAGPTKKSCYLEFVAVCHNNYVIGIRDLLETKEGKGS